MLSTGSRTWSHTLGGGMFAKIFEFERILADYVRSPYAVMTDCCTHAIELCLRHDRVTATAFTAYTYVSVPMTMHKLGIDYNLVDETWSGEYQFHGTRIWDSARRLERGMYRSGQLQCLSFGYSKPLELGHGGAILLDDAAAYDRISRMRYDGRKLDISPWHNQEEFEIGYHYRPTPEDAILGISRMFAFEPQCQTVTYPDCRKIHIKS